MITQIAGENDAKKQERVNKVVSLSVVGTLAYLADVRSWRLQKKSKPPVAEAQQKREKETKRKQQLVSWTKYSVPGRRSPC